MAQIPEYYAQVLQTVGDDLKNTLHPNNDEDLQLVRKGFLLFRQGRVSKVKVDKDATLATVEDVATVQVELNHVILPLSTCTCPHEGICRHQVAVFFQVYSRIGSVSLWIDQWKASTRVNQLKEQLGLVGAKDALKKPQAPALDYDRWIMGFENSFQSIVMKNVKENPYVVEQLFGAYMGKMKRSAPLKQDWKELYELILHVYAVEQLVRLSNVFPFSKTVIEDSYLSLFHKIFENVESLVKKLNVHAFPFDFDEFIVRLMEDMRRMMTMDDEKLARQRFRLYFILWSHFFVKKSWHEMEAEKLKELMLSKRTEPLFFAFLHQQVMLKRDEEAIQLFKIAKVKGVPYLLEWLSFLLEKREFERMTGYIEVLLSYLKPFMEEKEPTDREPLLQAIFQLIEKYGKETGSLDLLEKAYILTLPDSFPSYRDFLMRGHCYDKWCDLHLFMNVDIDGVSNKDIDFLEEKAPQVLLPLYHQAINKHISIKNRANYKTAVAYLKNVRAIYEKREEMHLWDEFYQQLLNKYRRLPAFYEECKRGL